MSQTEGAVRPARNEKRGAEKTGVVKSDTENLEALIKIMFKDLLNEGVRFKVMELLRALEFKRKTAPPDDREGAFWNMIDELRASELKKAAPQKQVVTGSAARSHNSKSIQKKKSKES